MNRASLTSRTPVGPWYREPWPWLIMLAPAAAIVGGISMVWLAITTNDGLVSDDYYRRGLEINRDLRRDEHASALKLEARARWDESDGRLSVIFASSAPGASVSESPQLQLRFAHRTRAGLDQTVPLSLTAPGRYEGRLVLPATGQWRVLLEDREGAWRLAGLWPTPYKGEVVLTPHGVEPGRN